MPSDVETFVRPLLGEKITEIHPAIDIFDNKAVVGVWIPSEIKEVRHRDGKDDEVRVVRRMMPYHVSSKREITLLDDTLKNNGYMLSCEPVRIPQRWGQDDLEAFLNNESSPPNPWELMVELARTWKEHVDFEDPREYLYRALWDMGTYFIPIFTTYPYDYFGGVKNTGKTTALMVHCALDFNAAGSGNVTTSSMYRLIQNSRCTFCVDETETLGQKVNDRMTERTYELRNVMLSGYKKGMPVYRSEKRESTGKIMPEPYETFGPKATACIKGLEEVLADRCKKTIMRRANPGRIKKSVDLADPKWETLRNKMYRLFMCYWAKVSEIYTSGIKTGEHSELVNQLCEGTREMELWKPILTMAHFVSEHEPEKKDDIFGEFSEYNDDSKKQASLSQFTSSPSSLVEVMLQLANESQQVKKQDDLSDSSENVLVIALLSWVTAPEFSDDYYPLNVIKNLMLQYYDEHEKQDWITNRWIALALRRLGFKDSRRIGTGYQYMIRKKKVEDIANRLGLELSPDTEKQEEQATSQAARAKIVLDVIAKLEEQYDGGAPIEKVLEISEERGIPAHFTREFIIEEKRRGTLYGASPDAIGRTVK